MPVGWAESKGTVAILVIALVYALIGISSLWWLPSISDGLHHFFEGSAWAVLWYVIVGIVLVIPLLIIIGLQVYVFAKGTPRFSRIIAAYIATVLCFAAFYTIVSIDGEWHTAEATYDFATQIAPHVGEEDGHDDEDHDHWIGAYLRPDGTYELGTNSDAFAGTRSRVFWLRGEGIDYEIDLSDTNLTAREIQGIAALSEDESLRFHMHRGRTRILDMLYFSVATISTLGYGDIRPISDVAVAAVVVEVLMGLSLALLGVGFIFANRQQVLERREDQLEARERVLEQEIEDQETAEVDLE